MDFFHEEFAALYLLAMKDIYIPRKEGWSLRDHDEGPVYIAYPGPIPTAEAFAFRYLHGRRDFPKNRAIYINTENRKKPEFIDFADVVNDLAHDCKHEAFIRV